MATVDMLMQRVRNSTLSHSLFPKTSLSDAVNIMRFVQIDPIKSPAPAQDLILRQRVHDYHIGDIDAQYTELNLEEDFLYAHGYMTRDVWSLLQYRSPESLSDFDAQVLAVVKNLPEILPKEIDTLFNAPREVNWWGGYSRATRMALDRLHYYGFLRVLRREKGMRIYQAYTPDADPLPIETRLREIVMTIVRIMAPVALVTLSQSMHRIHRHFGNTRIIIKKLIDDQILESHLVSGVTYLCPAGFLTDCDHPLPIVRFLAPFDPVVRDRVRFEHLWGWPYQFEAYVPAAKRIRGYYAMPVLWGGDMVGWINVSKKDRNVHTELDFVTTRPKDRAFSAALSTEIDLLRQFLRL